MAMATGGGGGSFQGAWGGGYQAAAGGGPNPLSMSGGGGGVLIFYQLDTERFNCQGLFNLVCQYGNVVRICFMKNKDGCAMVEMGDAAAAERVLQNLNGTDVFEAQLAVERSRKPYIEDIRRPHQLADGSESFASFAASRQNRFSTPQRAAKNRFIPPTRVLHFYNVPPRMTDEELGAVFSDAAGAPAPVRIKWLERPGGSKSAAGLAEFESVAAACEALVLANHARVTGKASDGGEHSGGHYEMKLCFSKASNLAGE
jgi:heterogeneous nuclear ribonucleoprotein L